MDVIQLLGVEVVVGIGKYAQDRAAKVLQEAGVEGIRVEAIMHPSPANPAANKGWEDIVTKQLNDLDLFRYLIDDSLI